MINKVFLITLCLFAGCGHVEKQKNQVSLHSICFHNGDYAGRKLTLQVTAVKAESHYLFSLRNGSKKYYCVRIDDGSGGHAGDDFYAYFPKSTFLSERDKIVGFNRARITIVGYVTIAPEADILVESYKDGWD